MGGHVPPRDSQFYCAMQTRSPIIAAFLVCLCVVVAPPILLSDDVVTPIRESYEEGDFNRAEYLALKALQNPKSLRPEDIIEIHKLLAFCYVAMEDTQAAINEFLDVLERNPRLSLEPLYVSPKIIGVFNAAKAQFQARPKIREAPNTQDRVRLRASMTSLLLPGLGQVHKGQPTRGYVFMSAQGISLGAWISLIFITNHRRDAYRAQTIPSQIEDSYRSYQTALHWRNAMGIAAASVYVVSFLDALYGPSPEPSAYLSLDQSSGSVPCLTLTIRF